MVGVATVNPRVTLRVKTVVFITPPPAAVTVTGKLPAGVDPVVLIFSIVEQAGLQEGDEKVPVAPAGNPDTLKDIAWLIPETRAAETEFVADDPATTDLLPELDTEKLKSVPVTGEVSDALPDSSWYLV
jgi:hypothetical protein